MDQPPLTKPHPVRLAFALLRARLEALRAGLHGEQQRYHLLSAKIDTFGSAIRDNLSTTRASKPPSSKPGSKPNATQAVGETNGPSVTNRFPAPAGRKANIEQWRQRLRSAGERLDAASGAPPVISIITPTFNTQTEWLAEAALSVVQQTFASWEWCIADDGSKDIEFHQLFTELRAISRIKVHCMSQRGGISSCLNQGLAMASGKYVCILDHDDVLAPQAIEQCVRALAGGFDAVYTDEDKISEAGVLREPFHKPEWSPDYFRGAMYLGHLLCFRRDLAIEIGGFDSKYDRLQDYEFMLRYSERTSCIGHIPEILYHWRMSPGSVAASQQAKGDLAPFQTAAVQAHLDRLKLSADAIPGRSPHLIRVKPRSRTTHPKVSIIVATKYAPDLLRKCLASLFATTTYPNFEVICVDNATDDSSTLALMRELPVTHLSNPPGSFNSSGANNLGAQFAEGQYLVFLHDVGALLLDPQGTVQHAGVVFGRCGAAEHVTRGFPGDSDGYCSSLASVHEVSAVSAACLMMRKDLFVGAGGFNSHFVTAYQDVDLCLQLRSKRKRNLFTPHAVFIHHESQTRSAYNDLVDRNLLLDRWNHLIQAGDPYYNRNLDFQTCDYRPKVHVPVK
jgi:O-antigen biosynthesis protein